MTLFVFSKANYVADAMCKSAWQIPANSETSAVGQRQSLREQNYEAWPQTQSGAIRKASSVYTDNAMPVEF